MIQVRNDAVIDILAIFLFFIPENLNVFVMIINDWQYLQHSMQFSMYRSLFAVSLDVIPVGADLVKIWGVEAELFLMIDDAGLLRATVSHFLTCV